MGIFQRKVPNHFIRIDPDNATTKDWLILLEAGTIVGPEKKLVPLFGEEIGKLIAQALESGIKERRPWYLPSDGLPTEPAINGSIEPELDTLVVDMPQRSSAAASA
jgi:hypothetical protein